MLTIVKGFSQPASPTSTLRQLTVNDGLPQGNVRGMVQDRQGFVWLASEGLSRYDGRNFLNYKHTVDDAASIANNDIRDLQIDDQDNLWITYASNEVDVMNAATGKLRHLSAEPAFQWLTTWTPKGIHFTIRQVGQQYFAAICDSLIAFDVVTGKRQPVTIPADEKLTALGNVFAGKTVLATTKALYRVQGGQLQLLYHFPPLPDSIYKAWNTAIHYRKFIGRVIEDKGGKWVIPTVGGVYRYDTQQKSVTYIKSSVPLGIPFTLLKATDENLYFSLNTGIYMLNDYKPPELVFDNGGYATTYAMLLADRSGVMWSSTDVHGINLFSVHPNNFHSSAYKKSFASDVLQPWLPLSSKGISYGSYEMRLAKDATGKIWLLNQVQLRQNNQLKDEYAALYQLHASGAVQYQLKYGNTRPFSFTIDKLHQCWMALLDTNRNRTLAKVNLQTGAIIPYTQLPGGWKENGYLTSIANYICYLPEDELRLYDTATAACTVFSSAQLGVSGLLLMALPDRQHQHILWIATKGSGIIKLNIATGVVQHYTEAEGLPNNTVYYITPDKKGFFWCSGNKGLFRFNPANGHVVAFTVKDGLQGNEFNRYHFLETPDGHFMFGGTEGYTVFHPDSLRLDEYQPPVAITEILVNNTPLQQAVAGWKDSATTTLQRLSLAYNQNFLTFSFAGLQYNAPEKLQYRYQLQGVDKDWVVAGTDASAKYASIPPGQYTFKVNASNTAGAWSSFVKTLEITILPPWWKTWWAYALYLFIIAGIGYALYRAWLQRVQDKQEVILKQKEAAQAQAMEETKSRFFANITHELRTPLTLIMSPVQKQLQDGATTYSPALLKNVYHHSQLLLRQINQLLDMSKLESGSLPIHLSKGNIVLFIREMIDGFTNAAAAKNIDLQYDAAQLPDEYLFDSDKLEKIMYNLLGNAIKFTPEGGQIQVVVSQKSVVGSERTAQQDGLALKQSPVSTGGRQYTSVGQRPTNVQIQVADTGIGIAPEHLPHIFDRFYQVNSSTTRRYEGTGIGLSLVKELIELMGSGIRAESTIGKGSVFTLTLPLTVAEAGSNFPETVFPPAVGNPVTDNDAPRTAMEDENRPLVLVSEDNEQLRIFIKESLQKHYRVLTAANGEAGLQTAITELPEIIISDVMMPVMDGYEFCTKVKENPLTAHIGFVMLTARRADESRVSGLRLGADHYLGKPFIVEELLLVIANLIKRQQKLREHYSRQLQPGEKLPLVAETEDAFLQSVYTIIESQLDSEKLDVDFLAGEMAVSRRTLNRKLAAVANTSANEIIRNYRLKKAAELLLKGEAVSGAAYATGFSTPSYFTQCFKEMYGTTPVQYIENRRLAQN